MNRTPLKTQIGILITLLVASIAGFFIILNKLDPYNGFPNLVLFYLDLFFLVLSLSTLVAYYLRQNMGQREFIGQYFKISFRQGTWFGLLIVISMILQSFGLFSILNAVFLVIALIFLESYFLFTK